MKKKFFSTIFGFAMAGIMLFSCVACAPTTTGGGSGGGGTILDDEPYVTKLEVTKQPTKLNYCIGEKPDVTGMELLATWSDEETEELVPAECFISHEDGITAGTTAITITYEGMTCDLPITAVPHSIQAVEASVSTCQTQGWNAHYACSNCHRTYGDSNGATQIEKPLLPVATTHTGGPAATFDDSQNCIYCNSELVAATGGGIKIQIEDTEKVSFYDANGAKKSTGFSASSTVEGKYKGSMESTAWSGNTIRIKVTVPTAGKYALKMRSQSTHSQNAGLGNLATADSFEGVSTDNGVTYQAVSGNSLPATVTEKWKDFIQWTITTLGEYELKEGENEVWVKIKENAGQTRVPNIDWFKFDKVTATAPEKTEVRFISMREGGFIFDKQIIEWGTYNYMFMRMAVPASEGADYYDFWVTKTMLETAGFKLDQIGTQTHTVSLEKFGKTYSGDLTITIK